MPVNFVKQVSNNGKILVGSRGSVVERFVHIEEAAGSIPAATTMKKLVFFGIWFFLILIGLYTIRTNTDLSLIFISRSGEANLSQRIFGILIYTLLFTQVMLGAYMQFWTEKLGGWIFKFHIFEGVLIYLLVLLHTFSFVLFNYFLRQKFDPIFVYLDFCLLCKTTVDYFYTIGRINFWLITVTVFAGLFRTSTPFMRANWRKFHVLNYLVFLLVGIHGYFLGTDFTTKPFFYFAVIAYLLVLYTVVFKKLPVLFLTFRNWLKD